MSLPIELQAARLRLVKERPYLAAALWTLQPVAKPGLGSLAVDMYWRLYFDPAVLSRWSVEELAGVLYHEVCHLLRNHAERLAGFDRTVANIAADAEINDDLRREGVKLPQGAIYPASLGQPDGLLAEEYIQAIQNQNPAPEQGAANPAQAGADQSSADQQGGEENGSSSPSPSTTTASPAVARPAAPSQDTPGSQSSDAADSKPEAAGGSAGNSAAKHVDGSETAGRGEESSQSSSSSSVQPSAASGQPAASGPHPGVSSGASSGEAGAGGQGSASESSSSQPQVPAPAAGRCGSCATGQQEEWEEGPPGEGTSPGISRAEAELIRREVARQIAEHVRAQGNVPGHLRRWAEEKLQPKGDWRKELRSAVRGAVGNVAGLVDYTYQKPNRRQGQIGKGGIILPSLRQPVPNVAIVIDTSGSVSDKMLAQALAEVSKILKIVPHGVHVLSVDAAVHVCRKVFNSSQIGLFGGGGTDMRQGIEQALKLKPRPDVIIVLTDGLTDWPTQAPSKSRVIVGLLDKAEVPGWARTVKIYEGG